jgi:response regulator RpfG family c-di-GMP phosphodiesterase
MGDHERLDGSGYPEGLKGARISDLVRLVAICDVHSALTERRVYRPPLPGRPESRDQLRTDGPPAASPARKMIGR